MSADSIAQAFHDTYERLAPGFGYRTREASAVAWEDVPEGNKALMTATVAELLASGAFREQPSGDVAHKHGQHGWHQHSAAEYREHQLPIDDEKGPHPILAGHPAQLTDGFHTMQELYDHRRALTAVLATVGEAWRSKAHHPIDDPMFEGYFIIGITLPTGPITYHYQLEHWDDFPSVPELEHAPKWDGAGSWTTVDRLFELVRLAQVEAAK